MPNPNEIHNPISVICDGPTLNNVLRQLRRLKGLSVDRDRSAGTVIVKRDRDGQVYLRALLAPYGWIVRYDSRLISKKEITQ